jgi:hypothetical protein
MSPAKHRAHQGAFASASAGRICELVTVLMVCLATPGAAETVTLVVDSDAAPRVQFGAAKLRSALESVGYAVEAASDTKPATGRGVAICNWARPGRLRDWDWLTLRDSDLRQEGFVLATGPDGTLVVAGADDSGALYGCLELARRVRQVGKLPIELRFTDAPRLTLRGTCIGMQKTFILPGRQVYEYPYTPELFPWFYDRELWRQYLDFLVENRMNSLYLWNGHPFASLVKLKDYPDAVEVPEDVFQKNTAMFHYLTTECDKRGIWLVQMFYNIFLPRPLAQKHRVPTQLAAPTPLASDYTRKAIAEFVQQYPNVGLMVCLGEALQGTSNQIAWATQTILPGVHDGMRAAGLKAEPPVVVRTHAMDANAIMPACFKVYSNLFTETKYNGESLTTYEPRGKAQATHLAMAKLGPHLVNVHILSNLEPFRYGAQRFIQRCVQASRDRLGASGLHLYPLAYWNWPYSPDIADPPLKQWERDWMWFAAWARYAWNPDVLESEDRAYWIARLADFYGNTNAGAKILDACNDAGEVAPLLIRRFGITEGNRQTLSLGMTLDQLVNPTHYGAIPELWESQAPPGERLPEFVEKAWKGRPHEGETPASGILDALSYSERAVLAVEAAAPLVTRNRQEFERLRNDFVCISAIVLNYAGKEHAAEMVLRYQHSRNPTDLEEAERALKESLEGFRAITRRAERSYQFANSMQTGHRKIPFPGAIDGAGTNYHWTQVLPLYEKELDDFRAQVAELKNSRSAGSGTNAPIKAWPAAKFKLISTNAETYEVKVGAQPFTDRTYTITGLAPELNGLIGIRFSHEAARNGRYEPVDFEVTEPVRVLIGYFQSQRDIWRQVPNLDYASHADERGGIEVLIRNAAAIQECPPVNVHAFRYEPGHHKLDLIGKGSFVVLGLVPQSAELKQRDAPSGGQP